MGGVKQVGKSEQCGNVHSREEGIEMMQVLGNDGGLCACVCEPKTFSFTTCNYTNLNIVVAS